MTAAHPSPGPSPSSTREPTVDDINQVYRTVRQVFNQTWRDFYSWKPPSTLPLADDALLKSAGRQDELQVQRHEALGRKLAAAVSNAESITSIPTPDSLGAHTPAPVPPAQHRRSSSVTFSPRPSTPSSTTNPRMIFWKRPPGKSSKHLLPPKPARPPPPKEGSFTLSLPPGVARVPSYHFCVGGTSSVWKPELKAMPFMPCFGDDADFDELEYSKKFGMRRAFEEPGRDADVEIIMVETVRRLKRTGLTSSQIDLTHVLPAKWITISDADLTRDLPRFPRRPELDIETSHARRKRKWEPPLEVPEEDPSPTDNDDFNEIDCARPGCVRVGCTRHSGMVGGTFISRYADHVHRDENPAISRSTILSLLYGPPCSDQCQARNKVGDLLALSLTSQTWPEAERAMLRTLLVELKDSGCTNLCLLREAFPDRTCLQVTLEMLSIARESDAESVNEPTITATPDQIVRPTLTKSKSKSFRIPIPSAHHVNFVECNHHGPCVPGVCSCANTDWPCGRNCGCPPNCMRRHQGCQCKRVPRYSSNGVKRSHRVCLPDKCPCRMSKRECDPELCGPCGAAEELDIKHRGDFEIGRFRSNDGKWESGVRDTQVWVNCSNVQLQKANWPKTRVGISPVAGYGLFAAQDIGAYVVLGEYVGEVISHLEGVRRDQLNKHIGRTYLFALNEESEVDAGSYGNETRFINSGKENEVNCGASVVIVNNEQRLYFQTLRAIKKHEEIRFDYGPTFDENGTDKAVAAQKPNKKSKR